MKEQFEMKQWEFKDLLHLLNHNQLLHRDNPNSTSIFVVICLFFYEQFDDSFVKL